MSSDTPFSIYGEVPDGNGVSVRWDNAPHTPSAEYQPAPAQRRAKRARTENKQGAGKKGNKTTGPSLDEEEEDEDEDVKEKMATGAQSNNSITENQLHVNEERLAFNRLELTPFVGASPAEVYGGPLNFGPPMHFHGFDSVLSNGGTYVSPAMIDPGFQENTPYHQDHNIGGFVPSANMANHYPGPISTSPSSFQGDDSTPSPSMSFVVGLYAPWAAPHVPTNNFPVRPSPASFSAPPDPATASITVNVQPATPQRKQEYNPPWSDAEVATLMRLAAEGVGYTGIHRREFSDRRTLKAVQMKYYALTSPDQRGPGKSPGKAKSNREE